MSFVVPIGFRMGWSKGWYAVWYKNNFHYAKTLYKDLFIKLFFINIFRRANAFIYITFLKQFCKRIYFLIAIYWKKQRPFFAELIRVRIRTYWFKYVLRYNCMKYLRRKKRRYYYRYKKRIGMRKKSLYYLKIFKHRCKIIMKRVRRFRRKKFKRFRKELLPHISLLNILGLTTLLHPRAIRFFLKEYLFPDDKIIGAYCNMNRIIHESLYSKQRFDKIVMQQLYRYKHIIFFQELLNLAICSIWLKTFQLVVEYIAFQLFKFPNQHLLLKILKLILGTLWSIRNLKHWANWQFKNLGHTWKGIRIKITGKFGRSTRARSQIIKFGHIPTSTLKSRIHYVTDTIIARQGIFGLKIFSYFTLPKKNIKFQFLIVKRYSKKKWTIYRKQNRWLKQLRYYDCI